MRLWRSLLPILVCPTLNGTIIIGENAHDILYRNVQPANISESYERIKKIPLKHFELAHDSVPGRRHMGIIGPDAQQYFPESVEVIANYTIPNRDRKLPPTVLINYPLVDKSVIFMHGLAAIQKLILINDALQKSVNAMIESRKVYIDIIADIKQRLSTEIDAQLFERKLLAISELELAEGELKLDVLRAQKEKEAIDGELKEERAILQYQETLARRRMDHQEELAVISMEKTIKLENDLAQKKEMLSRESTEMLQNKRAENELKLQERKREYQMEKIKAEVLAKIEQERANEDITIRKMQKQARLDTQRYLDIIKLVSKQMMYLTKDFFSNPERLVYSTIACFGLLLIYYFLKEMINMLKDYVQARLGRPSLVRETSVQSSFQYFLSLFSVLNWFRYRESVTTGRNKIADHFKNVMLCDSDKARVIQLALATRHTKRTRTAYRHLLLHGPPGTGKTLLARRLAECSGMDYAIMSGGDVGPLGEDAVTQLHGLFRWANRSKRGLLLFIDEAEAFVGARGKFFLTGTDNTYVHHALNALLYQTGTESQNFMMVLATNRPEDIDPSILDRIDISMHIGLPKLEERKSLVQLYLELNLISVAKASQKSWWPFTKRYYVDINCSSSDNIDNVALQCEGFSGREISKLFISCHYDMIMADKGRLSFFKYEESVQNKIVEHKQKIKFSSLSSICEYNNNESNNCNEKILYSRGVISDTNKEEERESNSNSNSNRRREKEREDYERRVTCTEGRVMSHPDENLLSSSTNTSSSASSIEISESSNDVSGYDVPSYDVLF